MSNHEEHESGMKSESPVDKTGEELHGEDSSCSSLSSSSDSENEKAEAVEKEAGPEKMEKVEKIERSLSPEKPKSQSIVKSAIYRVFGRQKSVHEVFGGGKPADVFLWRNKKISVGVLGVATAVWFFFELLEYHLLTLVCHILILSLALLFLWSNVTTFIKKSPPHIPNVSLPKEPVVDVVSALRTEINCAISVLRNVASGRDLKTFLLVIAGLWVLSIVGSWCNFITLFYIAFVLLHTVPVLYEKYEDQVDNFTEKATHEIKKQYAVFDAKVVSKIPLGPLKNKML